MYFGRLNCAIALMTIVPASNIYKHFLCSKANCIIKLFYFIFFERKPFSTSLQARAHTHTVAIKTKRSYSAKLDCFTNKCIKSTVFCMSVHFYLCVV